MRCFQSNGSKRLVVPLEAAAVQVCACKPLLRWPLTHSRCDFLHVEPTLPARPHHDYHAVGHLHRPHLPVRLAHADRLTGSTVAVNFARRNYLRRTCRGKPDVKRGAACSMLLSIDQSTHVHVSCALCGARAAQVTAMAREPLLQGYCVVVMLECAKRQLWSCISCLHIEK